jgi:hypothetical protein
LDLQPAAKSLYTPKPTQQRKNITPKSKDRRLNCVGKTTHPVNLNIKEKIGATR